MGDKRSDDAKRGYNDGLREAEARKSRDFVDVLVNQITGGSRRGSSTEYNNAFDRALHDKKK